MDGRAHFDPALFGFLRELAHSNNREWFQANKERYRSEVQEPILGFVADIAEPLARISPAFVADPRPSGGSMFRIYRDTRFSKDKSPYKTFAAAQLRHRSAKDVHAPGFYLHLEPDNVFAGAGVWHPDGPTLAMIRNAMVESPDEWRAAVDDPAFRAVHSLSGESLKRAPRGYDPEHPLIEDLKRKDLVCMTSFTEAQACSVGFLGEVVACFEAASPLMRFLTLAVGAQW